MSWNPDNNDWQLRHERAWDRNADAIVPLIKAWIAFADAHRSKFDAPIGDDGYSGPLWYAMGSGLIKLLSGDMGTSLDGGTIDSLIRDCMLANGIDTQDMETA